MFRGSAFLVCAIIVFYLFFGPALSGIIKKEPKRYGANKLEQRKDEIPGKNMPRQFDPSGNAKRRFIPAEYLILEATLASPTLMNPAPGDYGPAFEAWKRTPRRGDVVEQKKDEIPGKKIPRKVDPSSNIKRRVIEAVNRLLNPLPLMHPVPGRYGAAFAKEKRNGIADPKSPRQFGVPVEILGPGAADPEHRPGDYGAFFPVTSVNQLENENITNTVRDEIPANKTSRQILAPPTLQQEAENSTNTVRDEIPATKTPRPTSEPPEQSPGDYVSDERLFSKT